MEVNTLWSRLWREWIRFATALGTVMMVVWLSLIYWILLPLFALPFKLLADPLQLRGHPPAWTVSVPIDNFDEWAHRQG